MYLGFKIEMYARLDLVFYCHLYNQIFKYVQPISKDNPPRILSASVTLLTFLRFQVLIQSLSNFFSKASFPYISMNHIKTKKQTKTVKKAKTKPNKTIKQNKTNKSTKTTTTNCQHNSTSAAINVSPDPG